MLDGILFEKSGVPAVSIVTEGFTETGRAMARSWGLPNYRFIRMHHPIANLTEAEIAQHAREIAPQVNQLFLEGQE